MLKLKLRPDFLPAVLVAAFCLLARLVFDLVNLDDFRRKQPHLLDPPDGFVLAGDLRVPLVSLPFWSIAT